eukprot:GILK01015288.1.p1 GENE.GILK01015288.1~~GILK01015288.1.p1  ORF type:complete len:698 (-),score=116.79 GILK01015288.1:21-2114(-)
MEEGVVEMEMNEHGHQHEAYEEHDILSQDCAFEPSDAVDPLSDLTAGEIDVENEACGTIEVEKNEPHSIHKPNEEGNSHAHLFVFTNAKAGMQNVDQGKANQVIYEMSKNSAFFHNEQRKAQQTEKRIEEMRQRIATIKRAQPEVQKAAEKAVERKVIDFEQQRDLSRTWIHLDMDMFYAAVEIRDNPSLIDKPVAVGGTGMICTTNYEARKYGVRAAMPGFIGKRLCPDLIFVRPNFDKYIAESKRVRTILAEYDPDFESMSLDEAYLDITDYLRNKSLDHHEGRQQVTNEIRSRIESTTQLTASAGIASNRLIAKICTDMNKPNGQTYLTPDRGVIIDFMKRLNVRKIPGIGKVTERVLHSLGIETCEQLFDNRVMLYQAFSQISFDFFLRAALGISSTERDTKPSLGPSRKSISCERTFRNITSEEGLFSKCREICESLAEDVAKSNLSGKTVTIKLKSSGFEVKQRAQTVHKYIHTFEDLHKIAIELLRSELPLPPIRLMGVRLSHFKGEGVYTDGPTLEYFLKNKPPISSSETTVNQPINSDSVPSSPAGTAPTSRLSIQRFFTSDDGDKAEIGSPTKRHKIDCEPSSSSVQLGAYQCPICNNSYRVSNHQFNLHVDQCLAHPNIDGHLATVSGKPVIAVDNFASHAHDRAAKQEKRNGTSKSIQGSNAKGKRKDKTSSSNNISIDKFLCRK